MTASLLIPKRAARRKSTSVPTQPMPRPYTIEPMLAPASAACPVNGKDFGFEYKWDGVRAIGYWDGKRLTLSSRNLLDMTVQYPELQALGAALGPSRRVVLDGEV